MPFLQRLLNKDTLVINKTEYFRFRLCYELTEEGSEGSDFDESDTEPKADP